MYGLDTILEVRKMASEKGMNVTDISRETGISRMTIYKFLEKKDFNSSQTRKSNGKTVVDLQEIRKEVREDSPVDTDTAPTDGQKARDDEAQAAPPAEKGSDDGMGPVRALLGNGGQGNSKERPSKLDPYKPFIITCLMADKKVNRKQRYTDKKILELIRKQGYEGGHTIFDDFVRKVRK
ncbi:MAG: helix-turn-helix domain-containing protein, partial [Blautia sp.]|nr:helix-turn-helix domain-containing protein [Blautia sp.]